MTSIRYLRWTFDRLMYWKFAPLWGLHAHNHGGWTASFMHKYCWWCESKICYLEAKLILKQLLADRWWQIYHWIHNFADIRKNSKDPFMNRKQTTLLFYVQVWTDHMTERLSVCNASAGGIRLAVLYKYGIIALASSMLVRATCSQQRNACTLFR